MHFQIMYYFNGAPTDSERGSFHVDIHTDQWGHTLVTDTLGAPEVERRLRGAIRPVLDAIARDIEQAIKKGPASND